MDSWLKCDGFTERNVCPFELLLRDGDIREVISAMEEGKQQREVEPESADHTFHGDGDCDIDTGREGKR